MVARNASAGAICYPSSVRDALASDGFSVLQAAQLQFDERLEDSWRSLARTWENLEPDVYFGQEPAGVRHRRYTAFAYEPLSNAMAPLQHSPYFQSEHMNSYVGGMTRHFGDVLPETYENEFFLALVGLAFHAFPIPPQTHERPWICQVHQIRITVQPGHTTEVTPEGIHSDGYPFASVHLIDRVNVTGGLSRVYTYDEQELASLVFEDPLDTLLLEDRALKHHVTPISASGPQPGHRSILAISFSLPASEFATEV